MPDSSPHDERTDGHDRTAKIEELLLAGLDYYFAGEHDRAISVWTRVLFLDRGHLRARAYIERARGALAERQRESEALIQQGMAAFDQGKSTAARELLSSAVAQGGPHDVALALLERLNRLESGAPGAAEVHSDGADTPPAPPVRSPRPRRSRTWIGVAVVSGLVVAAAVLLVAFSFPDVAQWPGRPVGAATPTARAAHDALPLPRSADLALGRARALSATGHLKDALAALEPIRPGDPAHPDAERLRAEIQESLLAGLPPLGGAR